MDFTPAMVDSLLQAGGLAVALYVTVQNLGRRLDRVHDALLELARQIAHRSKDTPPPMRRADDYPPYGGSD